MAAVSLPLNLREICFTRRKLDLVPLATSSHRKAYRALIVANTYQAKIEYYLTGQMRYFYLSEINLKFSVQGWIILFELQSKYTI